MANKKDPDKYIRPSPTYNFLKYFRAVRFWVKRKYKIGIADMEMILYLSGFRLFSLEDFDVYDNSVSWEKHRFQRLMREGWIVVWRKGNRYGKSLYTVSAKARYMANSVHNKLLGNEPISENRRRNPIFSSKATYADKVMRPLIKKMNREMDSSK